MARFSLERKGYNKKEVDDYIQKTVSYLENKICDQNERIKQLKEETNFLYQKNDEYRRNEEKVSTALIKVMEIKKDSEIELSERNMLELERLKIFREKWMSYAIETQKSECRDIVDNLNKYMDNFTFELKSSLKSDLNIHSETNDNRTEAESEYFREQERIAKAKGVSLPDTARDEESEKLMKMCKSLGLLEE
ncbi:hypothetical protein EOM82_06860 [bacterium]|nr:hypothetical protein [bacterium]